MDHGRTLRPVENNELEKSRGAVRPEGQPTEGIVANFFEKHRVFQSVLDVLRSDVISQR
jgi:hypothetical protein